MRLNLKYSPTGALKMMDRRFAFIIIFLVCLCLYYTVTHKTLKMSEREEEEDKKLDDTKIMYQHRLDEVRPLLDKYPRGGTGQTVGINKDFDPAVFNGFCKTEPALRAVLPVYSSVSNIESRYALRASLGQWAKTLNCKLFFIVGMSTEQGVNALLKKEYEREKDILVIGKIDTYRDLNNKAAAMVEWIRRYCMNVPYFIHLIDDAYINLARFLERLDAIGQGKSYILGTWTDTPTERRYWLYKSYVTVEEYPYPRFPIYPYGFAYAFPSSTVERLHGAMYNATYCWIEDVWIAGHVREAAGVTLVPLRDGEWAQAAKYTRTVEQLRAFFIVHSVEMDLLKRAYTREV